MTSPDSPERDSYAESRQVQMSFGPELGRVMRDTFGLAIEHPRALGGGEESAVWRVVASDRQWVVRVSPKWRPLEALERIYRVVAILAENLPEVPGPRQTEHGHHVGLYRGHPVSVHPFVPGTFIDASAPTQRAAAARTLATVHHALTHQRWTIARNEMGYTVPVDDPPELSDPALDAWQIDLPSQAWQRDVIHGDFYPRNILWHDGRISGVLDWDELAVDYREQEVAWSIWEFCQNDIGTDLDLAAARDFLVAYLEAGGTVAEGFARDATQFIRRRLRRECRAALADRARGLPFDAEYFDAEVAAFASLSGTSLSQTTHG